MSKEKIGFLLNPHDGWPPTDVEHLWLEKIDHIYAVKNFPLFVKGIAYEDQISVVFDEDGYVTSWQVVIPSKNSLIWIYEHESTEVLDKLNEIGCGVESGTFTKLSAVNVPSHINLSTIDAILKTDEDLGKISIAYPVDRFSE